VATQTAPARATSTPPIRDASELLYSWKEIAAFLKCDVRTVQRWEKNEGLPVHRHQHCKRGTVYALKSEVQEWLRGRQSAAKTEVAPVSGFLAFTNGFFPRLENDCLYALCQQARERAQRARASFAWTIERRATLVG